MSAAQQDRNVLLVGSIPLADAKAVFSAVSDAVGPLATRIPDGETGDRKVWIMFQRGVMEKTPNLAIAREFVLAPGVTQAVFKVADPTKPVEFGALRYASEAIKSYRDFAALKAAGRIAPGTRFQVSLPTPLAVIASFVEEPSQQQVEAAYEKQLLAEMREILTVVPAKELALQWDVAIEVIFMAGWTGMRFFDMSKSGMMERLIRLGNAVPADVELGYHLCYGDPGHKHLVEPKDLALCVEITNTLTQKVRRPIEWVHMPVPRERNDEAYFAPLKDLKVGPQTEIFIGLVHYTDGAEGTRKRIETAKRFLPNFGIATECGFGRRPPETVRELLAIHKKAASA